MGVTIFHPSGSKVTVSEARAKVLAARGYTKAKPRGRGVAAPEPVAVVEPEPVADEVTEPVTEPEPTKTAPKRAGK